jgi:hypothetical protein
VPAAKDAETLSGDQLGPGEQTNMAFMNTPVTHGSATVIVTATGAGTELGKISGMLAATTREESPLTRELDRLTLWIAAAAGLTMIVMFALGRARGQAWDALFVSAVSLAIAAIPEALPTVTQTILSIGGVDLAKRNAIVKDLPSVETLGFTSAINSDKTGTLTMNQMTAVEVVNQTDRYTISGIGYGLDGKVHHAAGAATDIEDSILPYLMASDAKLVDGKVVGDPTEGALLVLGYKAAVDIDETRERLPRLATLPFDPTYKLMATFHTATDAVGRPVVRCFVKGAAPAVMARAATALCGGAVIAWDAGLSEQHRAHMERMEGEGQRVMAAAMRDIDRAAFDPDGDLLGYATELQLTSLVGMVDPPRNESRDAVASAQAAHIRVRMVTGDDVTTGAAIAKQVGIGGEAILGADFAALPESERLARIDSIGVVGRVAPEHKVLLADTLKKKGEVVAMTGDGVNDAPGHQGGRHRDRHGHRDRGGQERRPDDPVRRQLRHHRVRRRAGPQDLRQPDQVHPLRPGAAGRVRADVPRRDLVQHRRRRAVHASPGAVDPLRRQRPVRLRPRLRQGKSRPHGPHAAPPRRVGAHHQGDDHGRARRTGHHDRPAVHDRSRPARVRQRSRGAVDRVHRLRAVPDRGRGGMPQRDGHGPDHRHFRQQADELGHSRGGCPGRAGHPDGRVQPPAGHDPAQPAPVRLGSDPALALLVLWELGKYVARRRQTRR